MDLNIDGRLAVVSGAAGGIGMATAKVLAEDGAKLFLTDNSSDGLAKAAETLGSAVVGFEAADLTDDDAVAALAETVKGHGGADILVHMAGITGAKGDPLEMTNDDWFACWNTNFMSAVRMTRALVPGMVDKGWGRVVLTDRKSVV